MPRPPEGPLRTAAPAPPYAARRSPVLADNVAATSQPLATQAALAMMARGGNAVDAALAAAIMLTVVEPTGNGLGSDLFAIVWDGTALHGLNASGRAPAGWTPERFAGRDRMPFLGWDSVTVPGAVGGWAGLSSRFGRLPFAELFGPAIATAGRSFAVSPVIAALWRRAPATWADQPGFAGQFLPGGHPPAAGDRFVPPHLAATLAAIAGTGGRDFYEGDIARRIAASAAEAGAALSTGDLAGERPDWCGTLAQHFDRLTLHEIPPNGQGIVALIALGLLRRTGIRSLGADDPRAMHLQIEALKLAFADAEAHVADPAHMTAVPPERLLDPAYLAARARLIDPARARPAATGIPRHGSTMTLATADASGMMVSLIQSNYAGFGSGVVVPGTGIHLQNRGAGFALTHGHPNRVGPRKRPFHTIIPGFTMLDGLPDMAFGVMGGPMQPQGHVQIALRVHLWGQDVQTAIDAPRWRITGGLGLACEAALTAEIRDSLAAMGHEIAVEPPDAAFGFGGAQAVRRLPTGGYEAGSDGRKDGHAGGF